MTEYKNYTNPLIEEEEQGINIMEYASKLWDARKLLLKVAGVSVLVGVIIALTTPKQYTVNVTLAPEIGKSSSSSISGIASMLGLGNLNLGSEADALNVMLYPNIVSSTPFILDLLDTPIKTMDKEQPDTTLIGYLEEYTSKSLFGTITSIPKELISDVKSIIKSKGNYGCDEGKIDPFHLTEEQSYIVKGIRESIFADVDKKTGVTSVSVTMQDPLVAAIITDTVIVKLKEHITKYRVSKAQEDCEYWEQLNEQRKQEYYEAQKRYANYVDANKNVILQSVRIEQERLQNEMNLAYQIYSNVATQLQMAKAKVQEAKPVFAVVEPATVPIIPSGTSRKMILISIVFLAVAGASAWVLFGKDLLIMIKKGIGKQPTEEKKDA